MSESPPAASEARVAASEPPLAAHSHHTVRGTKIVATMGPATSSAERLAELFDAGVDVFRMNASHGDWEQRMPRIAAVRSIAAERGTHAAIMLDLQGPKIRLGEFAGGGCELVAGSRFTITTETTLGTRERASTIYSEFAHDVKPGDRVLLADGSVELRAVASNGVEVACEVVSGGPIGDHKGINLPGVQLSTASLTPKDRDDAVRGIEAGVDMIALSFVRSAADVAELRRFIEQHAGPRVVPIPLIAKIEKPEAWQNLDAILEESDGVMVARGDLGVEMALEKVPFIQKQIIEHARDRGKFVITATQMLESMIEDRYPTRAEVSDIANAICDGTDAVMLSAETSVGHDPGRAARTMARIAVTTENWLRPYGFRPAAPAHDPTNAQIIADAVFHAASAAGVTAIALFTRTGLGARLIARLRPPVTIYAFTPHPEVARQLALLYGVAAILAPPLDSTDQKLQHMEQRLLAEHRLAVGDNVVFVAGQPRGNVSGIDLIKLHRLEAQ